MKTIKHILIDIADNAYIAGLKKDKDSIFNLDQALKEIEELLLECKPAYLEGYYDAYYDGWNACIDDYEKNIKARL